jgi:hypothetical protein
MMTQLATKLVQDITLAVSNKYDKMIITMQENHNVQITKFINTQKLQAIEIATIKESQGTLKNNLEMQIHDKIEKQMMVLTSLVEIVQNMQKSDQAYYARNRHNDENHTNDKKVLDQESPALSDQDLSYSDRDE